MWEFLYPPSLSVVQFFLKPIDYDLIGGFGLTIPLRISWSRVPVGDPQFTAVSPEGFAVELKPIVQDEDFRDPESWDDVSPGELFRICISDVSQWLRFDPFGEVICADQQVPLISCCFGKGAYNVQAPLGEWP